MDSDRIFVSIGVSTPGGGLDELPGAITASTRMAEWAKAHGYATVLIQDVEDRPVTIDLLRWKIAEAIDEVTNRTELKRIVFFFAGHGAALAVGDQYWILSNWDKRSTEAIKVSALQRVLEYYGPKQVSIIGDACQEFSPKFIDLIGSEVLDRPNEEARTYELDQFFAVDVGRQAFMIKAKSDERDFCLFTEVLLDALEGDAQENSFDTINGNKFVTSQSLARHLDDNVEREASKHGVRMIPRPKPGFYTDRIYLKLPDTPIPGSPSVSSTSAGVALGIPASPAPTSATAPPAPPAPMTPTATAKFRPLSRAVERSKSVSRFLPRLRPSMIDRIVNSRADKEKSFVKEVGAATVGNHFETGCGICVSGASVESVEASFGEVSPVAGERNWFRLDFGHSGVDTMDWSDTLITLADERIVPVCGVGGFVAALHVVDDKSLSLFHRQLGTGSSEDQTAIQLLAQMYSGGLTRDQVINTAMELRFGKHRVITLGCIAAQFYDAIRDVASLRSIAAFYAMNRQPVPLDIVLYGGGTISDYDGRLYADIPAVPARSPRTEQERNQSFTYEATPGFQQYPIAGRIPWMRQAWSAVATASYDSSAQEWRNRALAVMEYLAPGMFTTVRPEGREALLALAGMHVGTGEPEPEFATV